MGNQQGKQRGQYGRYIDWEHAERPSPPGKPYLAPDGADQPDIIKIRWAKPLHDGGAPIIGYLVEHRRTGSPHWLRASPHLAPDTEFILTGLEPGWRYQFRISAENPVGRSDPGELSEPLTVLLQRSAASAPHFNRELHDTIALENETVELMVRVLATPAPKISWYKDGFELFSSRRTKIVTDNESSTLIIYQAALEDEGEIKCTATNRAGHAVTKANLRLEAPPRIRLPRQYEDGLIFEKGETVRLKVSTAGRPLPTVSWYHNGEVIISNGRFQVTDTDHGSALRITDACRDDRGEYVVKGTNKIADDCVAFLVTITDRPSAPGKPQVVMTLGRTVTLSWTNPEDDGGCKIGAFIVEYFRIGWDMWLKAATSRTLTAQLMELIEGSEYKFRVKAENPYGVSDPSDESDVIFIPDPKRGILKPEIKAIAEPWLAIDTHKRQSVEETETDATKKRRLLDETARKLLDSPHSVRKEEEEEETESAKRRKRLEENARKLLDTPMEELLGRPKLNTIEKPPRKKFNETRSRSVSPEPTTPPVPKRRAKLKIEETPKPMSPALLRDDSITHGSSELMLVIYPDNDRPKGLELSAQHRSEIELSLSEPAIAPPLSLSAPELGSDEPFIMPPMRNAVSSTELLHERAMARLYQDAAEEEMIKVQMRKKSLERRPSLRESVIERRHSFKEHSAENPPKSILGKMDDRMTSVEREQAEFAKIRDRLRLKTESQQKVPEVKIRPVNLRQDSTMSSQLSSFDGETGSEHYDGDFSIEDEEQEEEEVDYEEEEENYLEEESEIDLEEEEEIPLKTILETPPAIPQHGILKKAEEETYHPRSMIPTRGIVRALPVIVDEEEPKIEIIPEPKTEIPQITFNEEEETKIEIPQITLNEEEPKQEQKKKKSKLFKKIGFGRKKDKIPLIMEPVLPSIKLPKPILKKRSVKKKDKIKQDDEESPPREESERKKQVRISEPGEAPGLEVPKTDNPKLSPLTSARNQRLQRRQQSLEEEEQANKVLIYHYSDIVKEFGGVKKPAPKLYLDIQELEAHADEPPIEILDEPEMDETQMPSDQEERGSAPDISEVDSETNALTAAPSLEELEAESQEPSRQPSSERTHSPTPLKVITPEEAVRSTMDYLTDVAIFLFACWLYLFKNELYVIPVLILLVFRQLQEMVKEKYNTVKNAVQDKMPNSLKKIISKKDEE